MDGENEGRTEEQIEEGRKENQERERQTDKGMKENDEREERRKGKRR